MSVTVAVVERGDLGYLRAVTAWRYTLAKVFPPGGPYRIE